MTWAVLGVVGFMAYNAWQQYMNAPPGEETVAGLGCLDWRDGAFRPASWASG